MTSSAIIVNRAGNKRLARRSQNWPSATRPVFSRSEINSSVMRYPLITKNTSTPRNPPGSQSWSAW